jgi:nicotinate-nucleotide adenylyltransferase
LAARDVFGENDAVVSAIRSHTTGKGGMNTLEKIIYVADYIEPNRDFPGVEELRQLAYSDLDAAMKRGLEMTLEHLKEQGAEVSPATKDALDYLKRYG